MVLRNTGNGRAPGAAGPPAELAGALEQVREIELAVGPRRRADADDDQSRPWMAPSIAAALITRPAASPSLQELLDLGLDHRRAALPNRRHLLGVDVDPEHVVPGPGKTGGRGRADIAEAEDGDMQDPISKCRALGRVAGALQARRAGLAL